jgi:hypothetical protein
MRQDILRPGLEIYYYESLRHTFLGGGTGERTVTLSCSHSFHDFCIRGKLALETSVGEVTTSVGEVSLDRSKALHSRVELV